MSGKDRATLLMVQSTLLLYPQKGKAQVTPAEWLSLCDELLKSQSLGQIGTDLTRRREKVAEFCPADAHNCA